MSETPSLLEFPCDFPIKIMGKQADEFAPTVIRIVQKHAPDFDAQTIEIRASSKGQYLALTCTIRADSREQLDNLYQELSTHPLIKVVL